MAIIVNHIHVDAIGKQHAHQIGSTALDSVVQRVAASAVRIEAVNAAALQSVEDAQDHLFIVR